MLPEPVRARSISISHSYNGVIGNGASGFRRIDYILTRRAHRGRERNVVVHSQPAPLAKADGITTLVVATDDLGGRLAHDRAVRTTVNRGSDISEDSNCGSTKPHLVIERFLHNLRERACKPPTTTPAAAKDFTEAILKAAQRVSRGTDTNTTCVCRMERCENSETRTTVKAAFAHPRKHADG